MATPVYSLLLGLRATRRFIGGDRQPPAPVRLHMFGLVGARFLGVGLLLLGLLTRPGVEVPTMVTALPIVFLVVGVVAIVIEARKASRRV